MVGLLLDDDRRYFHLYDEKGGLKHQIFTQKALDKMFIQTSESDTKTYKIKVQFDGHILGDYRQWIVFDIGANTKLIRKLEVHVLSEVDSRNALGSLPYFDSRCPKSEREYDHFDATPSTPETTESFEALEKANYKEYMLRMLDIEEQTRLQLLKRYVLKDPMK